MNSGDINESSVEKMKQSLYQRGNTPEERPRRLLKEQDVDVQNEWEHPEKGAEEEDNPSRRAYLRASALRRRKTSAGNLVWWMFGGSVIFFACALIVSMYFLSSGANNISCENVDIALSVPASAPSGKILPVSVDIENRNSVELIESYVTIEYPEGTRSGSDTSVLQPTTRERIGALGSGETVQLNDEAIIFGTEKTAKTINVLFEYQIANSNRLFQCEEMRRVLIATSPVAMTVEGLEEVSSGQEVELKIRVVSNSDEIVPDVRMVAEYPFGFTFENADPIPTVENNVWDIGDMNSNMERTITVRGIMQAQGTEARVVGFSLGEKSPSDPTEILSALQMVNHPLLVTSPFFAVSLEVNNQQGAVASVEPGGNVQARIEWENALPYELYDVEVELALPDAYIEESSVSPSDGYYNSRDNVVLWTPQTYPEFATVPAGTKDTLYLNFKTKDPSNMVYVEDPHIPISFVVRARRLVNDTAVAQVLYNQAQTDIQFETMLALDAYGLYSTGPFRNYGPFPPRAEQETAYTLVFEITNTTSDVDGVTMETELPVNVTWLGVYSPEAEMVDYNPVTRRITWSVGDVSAHSGARLASRKLSVQVKVLPSVTDVGDNLLLTKEIYTMGIDRYTRRPIRITSREITTKLEREVFYVQNNGEVVQ